MRRIYGIFIFIAALAAVFTTSCTHDGLYDSFQTGSNFTDSNLKVVQIDTFTMKMSTFKYDSITSTANNRLLVGRYIDPYFGEVRSTAYADFVPSTYYFDAEAVFDSVVVSLQYDGYYYNDTLAQKTINIQQLSKEIRYRNGQTAFYNVEGVEASSEIIGSKTFYPRISNDSVTVRLSDSFGSNLFTKIQNGLINDADQLTDYFKGLKIAAADTEDASIIGFNVTGSYLRFYYSYPGDQSTESDYLDFNYYSTLDVKYFNNLTGNRAGTALESLTGQRNELASADAGGRTFIQSGLGITTKLRFPSIRNIYEVNNNNGEIFKAYAKMKINNSYYNKNTFTPDSLSVYVVDQNNDLVTQLTDDNGTAIMAYVNLTDAENNEVYLTVRVDPFLNKVITDASYLRYGLVLLPTQYNSRVTRLIMNGETSASDKSVLQLIYTIYDN